METNEGKSGILAIVTRAQDVVSGSVPIFVAKDDDEMQKLARYISKVLNAVTHDLENGTYIIVRH